MSTNLPAIEHQAQRVKRTLVQVGIPSYLGLAIVLPQVLVALNLPATSRVELALVAVATAITGSAAALTRIMAIPAINTWLTANGLGSVPRRETALVHVPTQDAALELPAPTSGGAAAGLDATEVATVVADVAKVATALA